MDGRRYHNRRYHKWMADVRVPSDDWRLSVLAPSWAPDDWRLSAPSWARSIGEGVVGEAARATSGIEMNISGIEIDMTDISGIEDSDGARSPIPRRGGTIAHPHRASIISSSATADASAKESSEALANRQHR